MKKLFVEKVNTNVDRINPSKGERVYAEAIREQLRKIDIYL
jgi:hypothetical protein